MSLPTPAGTPAPATPAAAASTSQQQQAARLPASTTAQATSSAQANAAEASSNGTAGPAKDQLPRDARLIGLLLASLGATDADPAVVAMLLEFAHRYTHEILLSSLAYAEHASRPRDPSSTSSGIGSSLPTLEMDDLRLAVSSKLETSYSSAPSKEFLLPLAAQINRVPLPLVPDSFGIRLPHERERLTAVNWEIKPLKEKRSYPTDDADEDMQNGSSRVKLELQTPGTRPRSMSGEQGQDAEMDLSGRDDLFGGGGEDDEDDDSRVQSNAIQLDAGEDDEEDEDEEFEMEDALASGAQGNSEAIRNEGSATPGDGDGEGEEEEEDENEDAEQEEEEEEDEGEEEDADDAEGSGEGEMTGEVGERSGVEDDDYDA